MDLPNITVGDSHDYSFTFTDGGGTRYDITGWTVYFTVKVSWSDSDDDALISKTVTSHDYPTDGETSINLTASETDVEPGVYIYDFQVKNGQGDVMTLTTGTVQFDDGVTDRT